MASPDSAIQPCKKARFAIEVAIVGTDNKPVTGVRVRLSRGERETCDQLSGVDGMVRYDGLQPDSYKLTCPDLDCDAWEQIKDEELPAASASSSGDLGWEPPGPLQDTVTSREAGQGDCLASIAYELGYAQDTIWNYGPNAELKAKRKNGHVLEPGDVLRIPPKRQKLAPAQVKHRYTIRLADVPEILRIRFVKFNLMPRSNTPYLLHIESAGGIPVPDREGQTDADGFVEASIPPDAVKAEIWFGTGPAREIYPIDLGHVNPLDNLTGLQARLRNLSYLDQAEPGQLDEPTQQALRRFQADFGLPITGEPDDATQAKLEEIFLS